MSVIIEEKEVKNPAGPSLERFPERPEIPLDAHHVILCCDCEGDEEQLTRLFESIQKIGIPANFFFVGQTAEQYPDLVREISRYHQSESHTYSHKNLRSLSYEEQRREILEGKRAVEEVIGRPTHGFRAPMHHLNKDTVRILNEEKFTFDASRLYFRYNMGKVEEIDPTWFREWMPLYAKLRIRTRTAFRFFKILTQLKRVAVLPAHPHYAGMNERMGHDFRWFLKDATRRGVQFWYIDDFLAEFRGLPRPAWRPELAHKPPILIKKA